MDMDMKTNMDDVEAIYKKITKSFDESMKVSDMLIALCLLSADLMQSHCDNVPDRLAAKENFKGILDDIMRSYNNVS